jgi:replicative superfamily II helicase
MLCTRGGVINISKGGQQVTRQEVSEMLEQPLNEDELKTVEQDVFNYDKTRLIATIRQLQHWLDSERQKAEHFRENLNRVLNEPIMEQVAQAHKERDELKAKLAQAYDDWLELATFIRDLANNAAAQITIMAEQQYETPTGKAALETLPKLSDLRGILKREESYETTDEEEEHHYSYRNSEREMQEHPERFSFNPDDPDDWERIAD